jgi:hypothetical protein
LKVSVHCVCYINIIMNEYLYHLSYIWYPNQFYHAVAEDLAW